MPFTADVTTANVTENLSNPLSKPRHGFRMRAYCTVLTLVESQSGQITSTSSGNVNLSLQSLHW